jgi:hypothetical protein
VFFALAAYASVTKRDFAFLGKFLFVGLVLLIAASLANIFFQIPALSVTISAVAVLIFSLYLLHDLTNIVRGGETNYVMATLNLFLSVYNIFISLSTCSGLFRAARLTLHAGFRDGIGATQVAPIVLSRDLAPTALPRDLTREQRDRFDVRRVRKHVDHARRREVVAMVVHQHRRVARKRGRVARDVDDPSRPAVARQRPDERDGALRAGGSTSILSSGPRTSRLSGVAAEQVGCLKRGVRGESVQRGDPGGAFDERGAPLDSRRPSRHGARSGSVKLPMPQKKSAMRSPGRGSRSATARRTSTRLMAGLTCVNSVVQ